MTALDAQQRSVLAALLGMQRHSWEQGVAAHALLDLGEHALAGLAAHDAAVRQTDDGRLGELDASALVNSGALGEVVAWAAGRTGDPALRRSVERQVDWLLHRAPRTADGILLHLADLPETWVDTVYMVCPLLVLVGETAEAARQFDGHRARLFDERSGLYGWRHDESGGPAHTEHWGTGSGWVVAAVARSLHLDPHALPDAADHARAVIDACLAHRASDGLFRNVVDDPRSFPEGNLAQMLAYATLTGVADGWLTPSYADIGRSLVSTARGLVDDRGLVQNVCGAPRFDRPGTSAEAQAFFLLATAAERRIA